MSIGVSVFLLAVGGVLAFAVSDRISGIDLTVVGYILMGAGALGIVLAMYFINQRSHTTHRSVSEHHHIDEP
jgi:RsiW-degrading membrane proteinase PrsW (M82 family)